MSTSEDNKQRMQRFYAEIDAGNLGVVDDLMADDFVEHAPMGEMNVDRAGSKALLHMAYGAFPDMKHNLGFQVAEGDMVVDWVTYTGTHKGDFMGTPAKGNSVRFNATIITRHTNGRIAELWSVLDFATAMAQMQA
jgi:steroid delta-isomerase-like uncharacterized protein